MRCLVRASSDTSLLEDLDVEIAVGDLTSARSLARAAEGCRHVFHCGALVSDWATTAEIARTNVAGHAQPARGLASAHRCSASSTSARPTSTAIPAGRRSTRRYAATAFATGTRRRSCDAEAEVRRAKRRTRWTPSILRPATVYGPGSSDVVGEIARAIRARNMLLVDRGRAVAGLCYVDNLVDAAVLALGHEPRAGQAFNVSDGLAVTWKAVHRRPRRRASAARTVRWSLPYWMANGLGFSLEHGYRLLRRTTGLTTPPLLSRQAVQVLGRDQDFSNRRAREVLGWEPRVDYSAGLEATLAWLTAS